MEITFAPRGILQIDDARICYRNFSGEPSKFNREGDRNFAVVIDDEEVANALIDEGWNVKIKPPRDEDDSPFMYLPVKVKFNDRGPNIYLQSGSVTNKLEEEDVKCLDRISIITCDMDIRPYDWDVNGKQGRSAYLQSMRVEQEVDRFTARHAIGFDTQDVEPDEEPF